MHVLQALLAFRFALFPNWEDHGNPGGPFGAVSPPPPRPKGGRNLRIGLDGAGAGTGAFDWERAGQGAGETADAPAAARWAMTGQASPVPTWSPLERRKRSRQ